MKKFIFQGMKNGMAFCNLLNRIEDGCALIFSDNVNSEEFNPLHNDPVPFIEKKEFYNALSTAFVWRNTKEGLEYWANIGQVLRNLEEQDA